MKILFAIGDAFWLHQCEPNQKLESKGFGLLLIFASVYGRAGQWPLGQGESERHSSYVTNQTPKPWDAPFRRRALPHGAVGRLQCGRATQLQLR